LNERLPRSDFTKTIEYSNGVVYTGEVVFNKPHGYGTKTYPSGKKYVGDFRNGKKCGMGIETLADGSKYVGEFRENKRNGRGVFTHLHKLGVTTSYEGFWKDNKEDDEGIFRYTGQKLFCGVWKDGVCIETSKRDIDIHANGCIGTTDEMYQRIYEEKDEDGYYKKYR